LSFVAAQNRHPESGGLRPGTRVGDLLRHRTSAAGHSSDLGRSRSECAPVVTWVMACRGFRPGSKLFHISSATSRGLAHAFVRLALAGQGVSLNSRARPACAQGQDLLHGSSAPSGRGDVLRTSSASNVSLPAGPGLRGEQRVPAVLRSASVNGSGRGDSLSDPLERQKRSRPSFMPDGWRDPKAFGGPGSHRSPRESPGTAHFSAHDVTGRT